MQAAKHPALGHGRHNYGRRFGKRLNALGLSSSRAYLAIALSFMLLWLICRPSKLHPSTHRQLKDQPDYTKISTGRREARLCNLAGRCSTWGLGRYDWSTLTQQGLYRDLGTVDVELGCTLHVKHEKSNRQEQIISLVRHDDCSTHCRNLVEIELSCSLEMLMKQWTKSDNEKIIVFTAEVDNSNVTDVTLVSQFSVNRLDTFSSVIRRWHGPISIAIYLTEPGDEEVLKTFLSLPENLSLYSRLTITIIQPNYSDAEHRRYPVNHLRNLALLASRTSHVFVIDADFAPSANLYTLLQSSFLAMLDAKPKTALVVPCYAQRETYSGFPETISQLRKLLQNDTVYITDTGTGHGPTLAKELGAAHTLIHTLTFEVCYESQWEPYYVVSRAAPLYDARFKNQGGDKQSHALHLNAEQYQFLVIRDGFIIHKDHPKMLWPGGGFGKALPETVDAWSYFGGFMRELESLYGKDIRWPHGCSATTIGWQEQRRDTLGLAAGSA